MWSVAEWKCVILESWVLTSEVRKSKGAELKGENLGDTEQEIGLMILQGSITGFQVIPGSPNYSQVSHSQNHKFQWYIATHLSTPWQLLPLDIIFLMKVPPINFT